MPLLIIMGLIVFFIIVFAIKGVIIVNQAEAVVIERLGKFNRVLEPGVNVIWPIIERAQKIQWEFITEDDEGKKITRRKYITRIDLRETVYDFPRQNVITEDNVAIQINAMVYFQVTDPKRAIYEINNLPVAIKKLTQTTLRNVIGEMDLDKTLTSRDDINSKLKSILDQATDKWGVKVNRVELQDIIPPKDIKEAMEKQMRAERAKRANILTSEGEKKSKILEAEGKKESSINEAQGEKEAQILRAQAEKEARLRIAEGEAKAIKKIADALSEYDSDPAQYLIALKYIEAFKDLADKENDQVVYLPYEISGVLGSLGGIKEMFNNIPKDQI
ncbi:SPFH domain-containing protein [Fuchsiella alkaliacetigena]|uniref:SPFH domain-containing protein n=1 Tax=Fuchsiella alkaliacetigena TaxID=957042 RepID=UPI00200A4F73|nr:SPFH domain-containing protein [Fuchsiella alkaliacetigena]MCK8825950.1 SPFH/Band 7/PHB domain protein [Fuchsiella alkaliacetigena]